LLAAGASLGFLVLDGVVVMTCSFSDRLR